MYDNLLLLLGDNVTNSDIKRKGQAEKPHCMHPDAKTFSKYLHPGGSFPKAQSMVT